MSSPFKCVSLFGGAMVAEIPTNFADVSSIREVPDHQEVYLDKDGFTNIIFEILERVTPEQASSDEDALKFHFQDVVSDTSDTTKYWDGNSVVLNNMAQTPAYTLFATQHLDKSIPSRKRDADFTGVMLTLIRLEAQKTDIIVTINVPHFPGEYKPEEIDLEARQVGPLIQTAFKIRQHIFETFKVQDWTLFVNEE